MAEVKPAATIMIGRDNDGEFQVLLVRRNRALAFAGGAWVFPGGKIEKNEMEKANSDLEAAKLAAVRETYEETQLTVSHDQLIYFRHWTTPAVEPRRFATWFFYASANVEKRQVVIDDSEIKEYQWVHPQKALDLLVSKRLTLMPPTFLSLLLIRNCSSASEASHVLRKETLVQVQPVMCKSDGIIKLLYEGDAGYDVANPMLAGSRHRLSINPQNGLISFEYENCTHVNPVTGGDRFFHVR